LKIDLILKPEYDNISTPELPKVFLANVGAAGFARKFATF